MLRALTALLLVPLLVACNASGAPSTTAGGTQGAPATPPATIAAASAPSDAGGGSSPAASAGTAAGDCGGDVKTALTAAAAAQNEASSYRVSGTVSMPTAAAALLEIQKPDRVHAKAGDLEFIAIGAKTWRKAGGSWQEVSNVDVRSLVGGMGQLDAEIIQSATFTNGSVSQGSVDGVSAIEYRYHESIPDQLDADVQMWLDPGTCRPVHTTATRAAAGTPTFDVAYSGWDSVTVEAPH
jgi:hypothetical protein